MNVGLSVPQLIIVLVIIVGYLWPWYRIFKRTGYSGWLGLLMVVPLVNLAMLLFLAFADWPALRETRSST